MNTYMTIEEQFKHKMTKTSLLKNLKSIKYKLLFTEENQYTYDDRRIRGNYNFSFNREERDIIAGCLIEIEHILNPKSKIRDLKKVIETSLRKKFDKERKTNEQ